MKNKWSTIALIIVFVAGLSLLLYPTLSDYWNSFHASKAVADYNAKVEDMTQAEYEKILLLAEKYNHELTYSDRGFYLTDQQQRQYNDLLDIGDSGIMGYIEIPNIDVSLPIYHGTSEEVLKIGIGHMEWSSLPVGGNGTHCVLSGHRGLPSARLFTNLDQLVVGDTFVIRVLNEVLTYEVDKISIVEPDDTDSLGIEKDKDLCTLITCTPYGINSHRMLVRGHRVENESEAIRVTSEAVRVDPLMVALVLALLILFVLLILLLTSRPKKRTAASEILAEKTENFDAEKDAEDKSDAEKGIEEKCTEEKGAEEKFAEEKCTEEKGAEEKFAEEKCTEEKGAEEKFAEEKCTEEKGAEEKFAEEKCTEEEDLE